VADRLQLKNKIDDVPSNVLLYVLAGEVQGIFEEVRKSLNYPQSSRPQDIDAQVFRVGHIFAEFGRVLLKKRRELFSRAPALRGCKLWTLDDKIEDNFTEALIRLDALNGMSNEMREMVLPLSKRLTKHTV
jgi:hypothetical protein